MLERALFLPHCSRGVLGGSGVVLFSSLLGMFLDGLDFSGPPCLQIMGSSTLVPALSSKCSLCLGLQRLLQASNPGTWRNNSDLSLDLFWQPLLASSPSCHFLGATDNAHGQVKKPVLSKIG